jgi:TPR repeat protein
MDKPDSKDELKRAQCHVQGVEGCPQSWETAFAMYDRLAASGNAEAQYHLANCYRHGIVVKEDNEKAFNLFLAAARSGHKEARFEIVGAHLKRQFRCDDKDVMSWLTQLAMEEHVRAQVLLAEVFKAANDLLSAFTWFKTAADHGCAEAMVHTAICYCDGSGTVCDYERAEEWLRKAADLGHHDAFFDLGTILERQGMHEQAFVAFLEGADKGHARCQNMVGWMFRNGRGVAQSDAQAAFWYEKAAFQLSGAALWNLALLYDKGRGVPLDREKADDLFRRSADSGYAPAQVYCAIALADPQQSDHYLVQLECNPGLHDALDLVSPEERTAVLVMMLNKPPPLRSTGLLLFDWMSDCDRTRDRPLLEAAAAAGSVWAICHLALTHFINNDEKQALELYNKAMELNSGKCINEAKKLLRTNALYVPFALHVLERASRAGVGEASFELGSEYESMSSIDKALEWYRQGLKQQNTACARKLTELPFCLLTNPTRPTTSPADMKISGLSMLGTTVIRHLFTFMDGRSLCNASVVCKHFHANASHAQLDSHWRSLLFNEFGPCLRREDQMLSCGVRDHPGHGSIWGPTAPLLRGHCGILYSDLFRMRGMLRNITSWMRLIDGRFLTSHNSALDAHLLVMPPSIKQQLRETCVRKRTRLDAAVPDLESILALGIHFATGLRTIATRTSWQTVFARPISLWHMAMQQAQLEFPFDPPDSPNVCASTKKLFRVAVGVDVEPDLKRYTQASQHVCDLLDAALLSPPFQLMDAIVKSNKRIDRVIGCGVLRSGDLCVVSCGSW